MSTEELFYNIMARETAKTNKRMGQYAQYQQQIEGGEHGAWINKQL